MLRCGRGSQSRHTDWHLPRAARFLAIKKECPMSAGCHDWLLSLCQSSCLKLWPQIKELMVSYKMTREKAAVRIAQDKERSRDE